MQSLYAGIALTVFVCGMRGAVASLRMETIIDVSVFFESPR